MLKEWYKDWFNSPFYHQLYFTRDDKEAYAFIKKLVQFLQPQPKSLMLDVACGKGRHSKILASMDYDVTGIDLSPDSIAYAKKFEQSNLHFYQHDMRLPFHINYFDYAFNFFTSFGYFNTRREHDDAMRSIAGCVKPGGFIVFDYLNVHYAEKKLVAAETKKIEENVYSITRHHDETHFYKTIHIDSPFLPKPLTFTEKVTKLSLGDFTEMFAYNDVQVTDVFGDYELGNYDLHHSPRLIVIGRKRSSKEDAKEKRLYSDGRTTDALT